MSKVKTKADKIKSKFSTVKDAKEFIDLMLYEVSPHTKEFEEFWLKVKAEI